MSTVFPSLSTDGYISDRGLIVKKIMEMFVSSFENQSNVFPVRSYKYIVNHNEHGMDVATKIENELGSMYEVYFEELMRKYLIELLKLQKNYELKIFLEKKKLLQLLQNEILKICEKYQLINYLI